ncbi:hypothetical protein KSS87_009184, partial [Heliosperma pusillum]
MKQGRLIVHTSSYNATMGNEARKTHCSHKELQCKQSVIKQGRLMVHSRSYNANNGKCSKEDSLFTQGVTMQQMGNEARKTHCSHKELQCKQWVMKQGRLIVHTRSYN